MKMNINQTNKIWSGSNNLMHVSHISLVGKRKEYQNIFQHVTAPILKPTKDQKPETFFGGGGGGVLYM